MPVMDTGTDVARAEQELERVCAQFLDRFGPELAQAPLRLQIEGISPGAPHEDEEPTQPVRVPAHALTGSKPEVVAALLHAMVHWVNGLRGLKDCCHRGYHNHRFRELAQEVGFEVGERVARFGWVDLRPGVELAPVLEQVDFDDSALALLLADLPADRKKRRPCRTNLPQRQLIRPAWPAELPSLPDLPRLRVELVRESDVPLQTYPQVRAHGDAAALLWQVLQSYDREAVAVLFLDSARRVIGWDVPYIGTMTATQAEPRGILAPALLANARAIAVAHNHPSGNPRPSRQDERFTHRLREAGAVLGVHLYASITIADAGQWCPVQPVR